MKTNKLFGLAALACGFAMSFTSCNNVDNPVLPPEEPEIVSATIGFESQALNDKGFWCGEVNEQGVDNGWGGMTYPCAYQEDIVKCNTTFGVSYWTGYAISNRTETGFTAGDFTPEGMPDQFNNITGKAHGGKNFAIVQTYGEKIEFDRPVTVKGFWYTNSSYTVNAILNGDGMTPGKFEADDWFMCEVYPTPAEGVGGAHLGIDLAKDGDYVKTWQYCDLSDYEAFENITSLGFGFLGTKKNDYGVTTPTYICIDDIVIEYEK